MSRFLYSSTALKSYSSCPASFMLWQSGAETGPVAENLQFGVTFHLVMEKYVDHCIAQGRHSDISMMPEFLSQAIRETKLSLDRYDELYAILAGFLPTYRVEHQTSVSREKGIAFNENLRPIEWTDALDYDSLTAPMNQKGAAMLRMKLDEVLLNSETEILRVVDYKTDLFLPSPSAVADPFSRQYQQAITYAWGAHRGIFPADLIEVEFVYARHIYNGRSSRRLLTFGPEEINRFEETLAAKIQHIEATTTFDARPGQHCQICSYRTTSCPVKPMLPAETPVDRMKAYLFLEERRDEMKTAVKADVAEYGFDGELGALKATFTPAEQHVPDMRRVWYELQECGIEEPWRFMSFSASSAKSVLDKDIYDRILKHAYDPELVVKFNVHQPKPALVALAEGFGIDTTKKTVAQLAAELARVELPPYVASELPPLEIDPEGIVALEEVTA